MNPIYLVFFIVLCSLICGAHALCAFGSARVRIICVTVGLFLHVPLFLCMLLLSFSMEVAALVFMASITLYTVLGSISYARMMARSAEEKEVDVHDV